MEEIERHNEGSSKNDSERNAELPNGSEAFGNLRHPSESFGSVPKDSEDFGNLPQDAEPFRTVPKGPERTENHTLTIREVARLFEAAGVARSERSIVNWCQRNRQGLARLDAYLDPNERRYFITPESVDRAIQEELSKRTQNQPAPEPTMERDDTPEGGSESFRIAELKAEIRNLQIASEVKERWIKTLEDDRRRQEKTLLLLTHELGRIERLLEVTRDQSVIVKIVGATADDQTQVNTNSQSSSIP